MGSFRAAKIPYLRKVFFFSHLAGLVAGSIFPLFAALLLGKVALTPRFFSICLFMGWGMGASLFLYIRVTLKTHFRNQLALLQPLAGPITLKDKTVEGLEEAVKAAVDRVDKLMRSLLTTVDQFVPHYRSLAESSNYLSERAQEGLSAALSTRKDIESMEEKQHRITDQMETLSNRTQDEAALSRQLAASLEEMFGAVEHSTAKFLETTTSVDEMASSIREVATQANEIARSVEGTAHDLDSIGESLEKIRGGAFSGAEAANTVRLDAENGLQVVRTSIESMEHIEQESHKARDAMLRLSGQTGEVVKIIEVIRELVSDTELLAFNAAIIAAKAGEEGRGFSVVAEEIRDLADRTTTSAQDIHRIVKAIGVDTREVTEAVDATGRRITKGKQLILSTGEALHKIVSSASEASAASDEIATLTGKQGERARALLEDAGHSLRSVKAIARTQQEQQTAINRIQEGVNQMKAAADQIAHGMEEQVRATRAFDQGLSEREGQIQTINEATRFQTVASQRVFSHFATSEQRLRRNAEKATVITREISALEELAAQLRELAEQFERQRGASPTRQAGH
jgi:methyl-accepting chemotaxis protein